MIYKIIFFTLVGIGGIFVVGTFAIVIYTSPSTGQSAMPMAAQAKPTPATVQTLVETPAQKLERAKRYLEPPLTRSSLDTAQIVVKGIPGSTAEYKEGQRLLAKGESDLKAAEARAKAEEAPKLREQLRADYERILSDANPHLNFIRTTLTKHKGGFALWGVHEYFSQYTFSIGDDAKIVTAWIGNNRSDLAKAGILRVGVRSRESWGGWCWFDV